MYLNLFVHSERDGKYFVGFKCKNNNNKNTYIHNPCCNDEINGQRMDTAKYFCVHSLLPFSAAADVWLIFDERLLIVFFTSFSGSFIVVSFGFLWFCRWPVFCTLITFPIFGMAYIYSNWQTKDLFVAARWC